MQCTLGQTRHPAGCWLRKSGPRKLFLHRSMLQTELSNFQLAAWNDWVLSGSDTSLTLGEFRHKNTCLVLVWWGAELAKLCKMLQSVSIEGFKTVVAIYAVEGPVSSVQSQCDLLQWLKVNVAELLFENAAPGHHFHLRRRNVVTCDVKNASMGSTIRQSTV